MDQEGVVGFTVVVLFVCFNYYRLFISHNKIMLASCYITTVFQCTQESWLNIHVSFSLSRTSKMLYEKLFPLA